MAVLNLRDTEIYIADDEGQTFGKGSYPTTRNGVTFGFVAGSPEYRNREDNVDPRIAGIVFERPGDGPLDYRVDVPSAGDYLVGAIMSEPDPTGGTNEAELEVLDSSDTIVASVPRTQVKGKVIDVQGNIEDRPTITNELITVSLTTHVTFRLPATFFCVLSSVSVSPATASATYDPLTGQLVNPLGGYE